MHKARVTTTACDNDCGPVLPRYIDFGEGGKPPYQEENSQRDQLREISSDETHMVLVVRGTTFSW